MEIKNYRSSVSYSLISYKDDGTVESEINYNIKKTDDKIILSWIDFVEESVNIGNIRVLKSPTPLLEKGYVLTYDIAYNKCKYTVKAQYADDRLKHTHDTDFVEQLTANLFEKSVRKLLEHSLHIPGLVRSQDGEIIISISNARLLDEH